LFSLVGSVVVVVFGFTKVYKTCNRVERVFAVFPIQVAALVRLGYFKKDDVYVGQSVIMAQLKKIEYCTER